MNNLIKIKKHNRHIYLKSSSLREVFARHVSAFRENKSCFRVTVLCPLGGLVSQKDLSDITHTFPSHSEMGF